MIKRLYDQFQPSKYTLSLDVDEEKLTFKGSVSISGKTLKHKNSIELHAKDMKILSASINSMPAKISHQEDDVLVLSVESEIEPSEVLIDIDFEGKITESMHGMYPCYFEHEGKKKKLIATQFESHHAREAFPCVDEPAAKATFDLKLTTDAASTVLGNTPALNNEKIGGRQTTVFKTTPIMSTYLLAFVSGEMHSLESKTKDGVTVRSWSTVAQPKESLKFSLSEAVSYIEFFNNYFKVPYPLEKCDQVALPDFESGAMENWGLITYRETVMLHNENNPSLSTRQYIAIVTAHELSHQWFGNLVTMKWWDDLWLNESFASMMEYIAVDALHPEWKIWEDFVGADCISATNRDVYTDVQPVRVEVPNPETIHTLFDPSIVYAKGGKLLKTLHDLIGEKAWREGLRLYFEKHAYTNTSMEDLWQSLEKASNLNISEIMEGWLTKPGLPLLSVDQDGAVAEIKQHRLLLDKPDPKSSWIVPLIANQELGVLDKESKKFKLKDTGWLLLNTTGTGHFVVDYINPEHKKWVETQIETDNGLNVWKINRLNELIMLAKNGTSSLTEALDTIKLCSNEKRAAVWSQISTVLGSSRSLIEGDEASEEALKNFTYELIEKTYDRLGWEYDVSEDSNTTHMRTTSIALAMSSENQLAIDKAIEIYESTTDLEGLPAEIRGLVMGSAVRFGKKSTSARLLKLYSESQNAEFRSDICGALTSTRDHEQIKNILQLLTDTETIRTQDTMRWFAYMMRSRYARPLAWKWLKSNWQWINDTFGSSKSYDDFARYSAAFMNTKELLGEYIKFFEPKMSDPGLKRTIQIGIKEISARVDWRERDEPQMIDWLKSTVK